MIKECNLKKDDLYVRIRKQLSWEESSISKKQVTQYFGFCLAFSLQKS